MIYQKPFLSLPDQADLLLRRGLVSDRQALIDHLMRVGYYRLSGYWYPFRQRDPANPQTRLSDFEPGTTFTQIWDRYVFDREMRLLVMDAIERLEVFLRAQLAYQHAERHDPFAYAHDQQTLPGLSLIDYQKFCSTLQQESGRSTEGFVEHFFNVYGSHHQVLPVWMATELLTFGGLFTFYRGCEAVIQQTTAGLLGVHDSVLFSWLKTFNWVRNLCAHHSRLWNRELNIKPKIPNKDQQWHAPVMVSNHRLFAILTICRYCLRIVAPASQWSQRLQQLLANHPNCPISDMGFPTNWTDCPIWR